MKEIYIDKKLFDEAIVVLVDRLKKDSIKKIYGVPKNGVIIAMALENKGFEITNVEDADAIVDDLIDSGRTRDKYKKMYPDKPFYTLLEKKDQWLAFWFENTKENDDENLIVRQLESIGENPNRQGLQDTPRRVVNMWKELFRGYDINQKPRITTFMNGEDGLTYDQMVIDEGDFYSQCEHHLLPFFGKYYFAYIPNPKGKILGLSKVARVVDYHSAKLQIQERLVQDIVNDLWNELTKGCEENPPLGMALVMVGEHLCKSMRGVKKKGQMTSSELRGVFRDDNNNARNEFMNLIK